MDQWYYDNKIREILVNFLTFGMHQYVDIMHLIYSYAKLDYHEYNPYFKKHGCHFSHCVVNAEFNTGLCDYCSEKIRCSELVCTQNCSEEHCEHPRKPCEETKDLLVYRLSGKRLRTKKLSRDCVFKCKDHCRRRDAILF